MSEKTNASISDKQKIEAAYALNLCTVSLTQIMDYSDPYILEQEYDAILNNLNIQNIIHDDALLVLIKKIMETLTFYRIQEGDKKFLEKEYQGKLKNAIWSAVPSLSVILAGGNPVTVVAAIATQVGIGYMNYRKTKSQDLHEKEKKEWELKRALIDEISGLQRELFETAWKLSERYQFDDSYRLTEKQIRHYSLILMDNDPLRRYERLDVIKDIFRAFPPFWYYKGNAAKEIASKYEKNEKIVSLYKTKALEDYRRFNSSYIELMREDVIASSCAIEQIALLDKNKDIEEIKKLLDNAMKYAGDNFDVLQIIVLNYISIGEKDKAKSILRRLVNENYNIGLNGLLLSRIYFKWENNKEEYVILSDRIGKNNIIPWIEDDSEADKKFIEDRENTVSKQFSNFIDTVALKYKNLINQTMCYDNTLRLKNQIDWCLSVDITKILVDKTNDLFCELNNNELFLTQKRADNKLWRDFFIEQSILLNEKIKLFNKMENKIKKAVIEILEKNPFGILDGINNIAEKAADGVGKAFDGLNNVVDGKLGFIKSGVSAIGNITGKATEGKSLSNISGNDAEKENLKKAIQALLKACDLDKYLSDFLSSIKEEFKKSLSVESIVSLQENMLIIIYSWYRENGFDIHEDVLDTSEINALTVIPQNIFFQYPD